MKVLAGIVLYNPDEKRLLENMQKIISQVDKVICIDNHSNNINKIKDLLKKKFQGIEIICNNDNKGIAYALNQILDYAYINQYEWFITLDQDSVAKESLISNYKKYIEQPKVAMLTCEIIDRNFKNKEEEKKEFKEINKCITSGTFNNTKILREVGGYDSDMFIDSVDFDICATLRENGYRIIRINYKGLLHEVGHASTRRFLWKKVQIYNHSPFRTYYIIRNGIYYAKKHKSSINVKYSYFCVIKRSIYILLYQKEKWKNFKAIIKGIKDGIRMEIKKQK